MKKHFRRMLGVLGMVILMFGFGGCQGQKNIVHSTPSAYTGLKQAFPFIDTWRGIHLFAVFDYNIHDPSAIAPFYDFIWGAAPEKVKSYQAAHPGITLSYYIPFHRDPGLFNHPDVVSQKRDLAYWQQEHPDWILYKCDRKTVAYEYGEPNIPLDISNPEVVTWQIENYAKPASKLGFTTLAADNLSLENHSEACGVYRKGKWVQRYSGSPIDQKWQADVLTWLATVQQALHALPDPMALVPNLVMSPNFHLDDPVMQQVIKYVDGILDESSFTSYGEGYVKEERWLALQNFIHSMQAHNKPYFGINQFKTTEIADDHVQWALASYLLMKGHQSYLFITHLKDKVQGYGSDVHFPQYTMDLGEPLGDMYYDQKIYWRRYTGGLVMVNPSDTNCYQAKIDGQYRTWSNYPIRDGVILPPHSGLVLMKGP